MALLKKRKDSKYDITGLSKTQISVIYFLLSKIDDNCLNQEGKEFYSNDNFAIRLNSAERKALKSFIKNLLD